MEPMAHDAIGAELCAVVRAAVTFPAPADPRHEDVAALPGMLRLVVTRGAGLGDVGRMIEPGARHPVLGQPDRRDLPLIESAGSQHMGHVVAVDTDPLLE